MVVDDACRGANFMGNLRTAQDPDMCVVDLTRMVFCEPIGLVAIACLVESASSEGRRVVVHAPTKIQTANYLARMGLGEILDLFEASHNLAPAPPRDKVTRLILKLSAFDGETGLERLGELIYDAIEGNAGGERASALHTAVCEVGQNVPQHSGQQRGWVTAQRTERNRVSFGVGDSGRGVLATLRAAGATSDREALRLAVEEGVSEEADPSRGRGLPEVVRLLSALGGELQLVSGTSSLSVGRRRHLEDSVVAIRGTIVQGHVRLPRRRGSLLGLTRGEM